MKGKKSTMERRQEKNRQKGLCANKPKRRLLMIKISDVELYRHIHVCMLYTITKGGSGREHSGGRWATKACL